jgi:hypothetical protein
MCTGWNKEIYSPYKKISINIANEARKTQHQVAEQHFYFLINSVTFRLPEDCQQLRSKHVATLINI